MVGATLNPDMVPAVSFPYEPLDPDDNEAFRLLKILPGKGKDPIDCKIRNVSLAKFKTSDAGATQRRSRRPWKLWKSWFKPRNYECISYAWGEDQANSKIFLNKRPIYVSPTLESALRNLRTESSSRTIWIDAVCIDQTNDIEKAKQIRFMQKIYANADRVIVWLGESSPDSDVAIAFSKEIADAVSPTGGVVTDIKALRLGFLNKHHLLDGARLPGWIALYNLIKRTWWRRAWVVQEVVVAQTIIFLCGSITVSWEVLGQAVIVARSTYPYFERFLEDGTHLEWFLASPQDCQGAFDLIYDHAEYHYTHHDTLMWLGSSRKRFCRLPHDKVFSVLGLTSENFRNAMQIDYTRTVEEVFKDVAKAHIEATDSLNIISYSQYSVWRLDVPSWVPDWRLPSRLKLKSISKQESHLWPAIVTFSPDLSELTVRGKAIASITETSIEAQLIPGFIRIYNTLAEISDETLSQSSQWFMVPHIWDDILASANLHWNLKNLVSHTPDVLLNIILKIYEMKWKPDSLDPTIYERTSLPQDTPGAHQDGEFDMLELLQEIRSLTKNASIVATNKDFLGLAPDFTQSGDVIYIMSGCFTPVVLRPCGEGRFRFLGDIFLGSVDVGEDFMFPSFSSELFPDLEDITLV